MTRMDYNNFDDYWSPVAAGEGPFGKFMSSLDPSDRAHTKAAPDGPRSFANVAWACRGIAP